MYDPDVLWEGISRGNELWSEIESTCKMDLVGGSGGAEKHVAEQKVYP